MTDILEDIRRQLAGRNDVWTFEVDEIAGSAAAKLKDLAPEAAVAFAIEALRIIRDDRTWLAPVLNRCVSHVLRRKLPFTEDDVVVQLTVDDQGRVVDYSIPNDVNSKLRNDIANMILFAQFHPATEFGMPIAGKVLVSFRRDKIVVRG